MIITKILIPIIISFFGALVLTPVAKKIAQHYGMVDEPNERKVHRVAVARGGGLAIYAAFILGVFAAGIFSKPILGFLVSSLIVVCLGAVDDKHHLRAMPKFAVQSLAAVVAISFGIEINMNQFLVGHLSQYAWLSIPLTFFWLVGITNAINIIDGLDGLAAGVSTIAALAIATVSFMSGDTGIGIMSLLLAAASLGFLPHNFRSRIFMGDSGSLFLGFSLAAFSIMGSVKLAAAFSLLVPMTILLIPIFDTLFAIFRRLLKHKSIFEGDRRHFHHRLIDLGLSPLHAVLVIYLLSAILSATALFAVHARHRIGYILFGTSLIFIFIVTSVVVYLHQKKTNHI